MLGRDLDILPADIPVHVLVLDANVREVDLLVEVRQGVFVRPLLDLLWRPVRSPVAVRVAPITLLEKALVLAFQLAIELHAQDARLPLLQALGGAEVGAIELHIVGPLVVFDTSSSLAGKRLAALKAAGEAFLRGLRPADQMGLVGFSEEISWLVPATTDKTAVRRALDQLEPAGAPPRSTRCTRRSRSRRRAAAR
jgi:hypothetical protein